MTNMNYYTVLGVDRNASAKEVKRAFRRLARQHHPDVNPGNEEAERRFKEINEANEVLSNPETRRAYDTYGDQWRHADKMDEMRRQRGFAGDDGGFRSRGGVFSGMDGIFSQFFGGTADGFGRQGERIRTVPSNVEASVEVTLEEAFKGATRTVTVPGAHGRTRRLQGEIPAGVDTGSRVRITGAGPQTDVGAPGDLYLNIAVRPHRVFTRRGADLTTEVPVSVYDAMLGGEIQVPTLGGKKLALKVPRETQNGKTFRLSGQGMPRMGDTRHGDLYAKVVVTLPSQLSEREQELVEELKALQAGGNAQDA